MAGHESNGRAEDGVFDDAELSREAPLRPQRELDRPRLALPDELRSGSLGLAALFAPAGYGKSTVMARWRDALQADGTACCWLGLGDKHRDPKTLCQALLHALRHQVPGLAFERTDRNLRSATSYIIEPVLASLMQELEAGGQRIVLFLDDLENLEQSPGKQAVAMLIEHRPEGLGLVLGGRDNRQFALAPYRLARKMIELRAEDLSFRLDEIKALFADHFRIEVDEKVLAIVADKTEGWPAALSLYALGVEARGDAAASLDKLVGGSGELADYLGEVLLESLEEETRDLLMRAAVPEHFRLELLQVLVPDVDAAQALARIRSASLFLHTADTQGREYRFHSLCADFLRRRLRESRPGLYAELLHAAGDWSWSHGEFYEAVNYAREAEDWTLMAQRLTVLAERMVRATGEFDTYLEWLRDLPADVIKAHPQLLVHQAWALGFSRDMAQAEIALTRLESLLPAMSDEQARSYRRQLELHRFLIEAIMDRAHPIIDAVRGWFDRYPDAPEIEQGLIHAVMSTAARNSNQLTLALRSLEEAEGIFQKMGGDYSLSWVHNVRLSVLIKSGNFADARVLGRRGLNMICDTLGDQSPPAGMSNAMLAYLTYEEGEVSTAREHLDNGLRFIANQGVVDPLYFAHLTQSWLAADDGHEELALDILLEGEQLGIEMQLPRLTTQLAMRRALLYLYLGDQMAADALIENRQLLDHPDDAFAEVREQCAGLLRANMDLLQGRFREAGEHARSLSRRASSAGGLRMKAEYDYLWAIALHNAGEANEAGRRFRELLAQAAVQQRYRFMLQYRSLGRALIMEQCEARQRAWDSGAQPDAADRILKALAASLGLLEGEGDAPTEGTMLEGLTRREIDILKRAARTGLNNKKLAAALFVSEGTLKWHLHNIYSKLDVRNRAGAIAQAQRMGLLDA